MARVSFQKRIQQWSEQTREDGQQSFRAMGLDLIAGLMKRTPVKSGRARAGYRARIGSPDTSVEPPHRSEGAPRAKSNPSDEELAPFKRVLEEWQFQEGQTLYVTNNVFYISRLDRGGSDQAPRGFSRLSYNAARRRFPEIVQKAKRDNRRRR